MMREGRLHFPEASIPDFIDLRVWSLGMARDRGRNNFD
jgi:hypothetical protein